MKLTDLAIVFQLFFICLLTVLHVKSNTLHAEAVGEIMYNNVMDGIVEDALRAGYETIDNQGKPVVKLEEVKKCFLAEKALYSCNDRHIMIYVDEDGFFVWDGERTDKWSSIIMFSPIMDDEEKAHERKVYELTEYLRTNYGISISIPLNSGENMVNTIEVYSLIVISFNRNSEIKSFSGAKIHKIS